MGSGPPHDATVSLGRRVLRLWLLVTRWRHPPSRVFRPIYRWRHLSPIPPLYHQHFESESCQALFPLHPHLYSLPRSRSHSRPHSYPRPQFRAHFRARPRSRSCSRQRPRFLLLLLPGALFYYPLGSISSGRRQVLRPKPLATVFVCVCVLAQLLNRTY